MLLSFVGRNREYLPNKLRCKELEAVLPSESTTLQVWIPESTACKALVDISGWFCPRTKQPPEHVELH